MTPPPRAEDSTGTPLDEPATLIVVVVDEGTGGINVRGLSGPMVKVMPDPSWTSDGVQWLDHVDAHVRAADPEQSAVSRVVIAHGDAIPYAVSLATARPGIDVALLFPTPAGKDRPPENTLSRIQDGQGDPVVIFVYERWDSGSGGPRNGEWLSVFARSRLAAQSHFDYLPRHQFHIRPQAQPGLVADFITRARQLRRNAAAIKAVESMYGTTPTDEVIAEARSTYQGTVALWNHYLHTDRQASNWVSNKVAAKEWAQEHGFPVAKLRAVLDCPEELTVEHFNTTCVLKPVSGSSSLGVRILRRAGDSLIDVKSGTLLDVAEVQRNESEILGHMNVDLSPRLLLEEPVIDPAGGLSQFDYKFFFSGGEVVLAMITERTAQGIFCYWTDAQCRLVQPNPVWTNSHYRHVRQVARPSAWNDLLSVASDVYRAAQLDFTRIDLYLGADGPVFGEITPTPGNFYFGNSDKISVGMSQTIAQMTTLPPHLMELL